MNSTTRISFSAVTHIGTACTTNDDRIYANGRFTRMNAADCVQTSLEETGSQFLFALADGMTVEESGISVINELKRFQAKIRTSSKNINVKVDELAEIISQTSNLLHSLSIGERGLLKGRSAFSGILIDNGSIAAVNMGASRIYQLDGEGLNLVVNDYRRTDRLRKLGIINDEQADMLSGQRSYSGDEEGEAVRRSEVYPLKEGASYLLCSGGLVESVSEDAIYDIMNSSMEADIMASRLVEEALKNGSADNISAVIVHIGEAIAPEVLVEQSNARNEAARSNLVNMNQHRRSSSREGTIDISKVITALLIVVIIAAIFFAGFTMWLKLGHRTDDTLATAGNAAALTSGSGEDQQDTANGGSEATGAAGEEAKDEDAAVDENADAASDTDKAANTDNTADTGNSSKTGGTVKTAGDKQEASSSVSTPTASIPKDGKYTIKRGDKLMKLAVQFYGDESKYTLIMEANGLTDPNKIKVGDVLKIPELK